MLSYKQYSGVFSIQIPPSIQSRIPAGGVNFLVEETKNPAHFCVLSNKKVSIRVITESVVQVESSNKNTEESWRLRTIFFF